MGMDGRRTLGTRKWSAQLAVLSKEGRFAALRGPGTTAWDAALWSARPIRKSVTGTRVGVSSGRRVDRDQHYRFGETLQPARRMFYEPRVHGAGGRVAYRSRDEEHSRAASRGNSGGEVDRASDIVALSE